MGIAEEMAFYYEYMDKLRLKCFEPQRSLRTKTLLNPAAPSAVLKPVPSETPPRPPFQGPPELEFTRCQPGSKRWKQAVRRMERKLPKKSPPHTPALIRTAVLERDGHKCFFCRSVENLHVHHMLPRREGGTDDMDNLLTVCGTHHAWLHEGEPIHRLMRKSLGTP